MKARPAWLLVLACLLWVGCGAPGRSPAAGVRSIATDVTPFLDAFNAAAAQPRVLLIISPT